MPLPPLRIRTHGDAGPRVAVLHGGPGAPGSAHGLATALAETCRVLEPLQRGSGDVRLTVARHVEDLDDAIAAWAAAERVALVGWSWGAMLALAYAALHPQRPSRIALVGCGTFDVPSREARARTVRRRLGDEPPPSGESLEAMAARIDAVQSLDPIPDAVSITDVDERGHHESWDDMLARQADGTYPAAFARVRVPVAMFHGDFDPHPGPSTRDTLARWMPQLEYREFTRCGHTPWLERRAREGFLQSLRAWLLTGVVQGDVESPQP